MTTLRKLPTMRPHSAASAIKSAGSARMVKAKSVMKSGINDPGSKLAPSSHRYKDMATIADACKPGLEMSEKAAN